MTLDELFELLEDAERLVKAESGGETSGKGSTSEPTRKELIEAAKRRGIRLPRKGL